ncbi:MAG: hypothetical protein XFASWVDF_002698 [Candidatus Fervidibacter sp.]|jgi:hypothetical protein
MKGVKVVGILSVSLAFAFAVASLLTSQCPDRSSLRVNCQHPCVKGDLYESNTWCIMATEGLCCEYDIKWYECDYMTNDPDNDPDPRCNPRTQWEPVGGPREYCRTCERVPGTKMAKQCVPQRSVDCVF